MNPDVQTTIEENFGGDTDLFRKYTERFSKTVKDRQRQLNDEISEKRYGDAGQTAHLMRGSASIFGFGGVSEALLDLENLLRNRSDLEIEIGMRKVNSCLGELELALNEALN